MVRVQWARFALVLVAVVVAAGVTGCNMRAIPGLTTPDYALSTPAPLLPPGAEPIPTAPPGVPVSTSEPYTLDSGDRLRIIVFGQENLSGLYSVDASGCVALPLSGRSAPGASPPSSLPPTSPACSSANI
jgi:polysaccharide export outer membrane protein